MSNESENSKYLITTHPSDDPQVYYLEKGEGGSSLGYATFCPEIMDKYRGIPLITAKNDGNGVDLIIGRKKLRLDYSELFALQLLMNFSLNEKDVKIKTLARCKINE